jgi:hypothetical protein
MTAARAAQSFWYTQPRYSGFAQHLEQLVRQPACQLTFRSTDCDFGRYIGKFRKNLLAR